MSVVIFTAKHAKTANKKGSVPRKTEDFQEALSRPSKGRRSSKVSTEVECTPLKRKRGLDATRATIFWEVSFPCQVDDKHEDILHIRSYGEAKEDCLDDWDHEE